MGNGHALEIGLKKKSSISPENYLRITEMKAASIEGDMYLGALFGGGKDADVEILAKIGRILGILATLRDDLIDVFDIEELFQRISTKDLPLPLLFAMREREAKRKIKAIISKDDMTEDDISKLVDITLKASPVIRLRNKMQLLIKEGIELAINLTVRKMKGNLQTLLSFMLEDL
jgi:geranylgeranyl pyrophosphate synthase